MTMRWIATTQLARDHGLNWMEAERIISEETARVRRKGRSGVLLALANIACLLWVSAGARLAFPGLGRFAMASAELPAVLLMTALLVLSRLLAHDAILARAREHDPAR
jgi:hypothetical protein